MTNTLNKEKPLVSVIIPAYNVERYISKCLASVVQQDYRPIEVIVIDDGSTDQTGELVDKIAEQDTNILAVHVQNAGVSAARNCGLKIAQGEFVVFVDADDFLAKDFIGYMVWLIQETESEFAFSTKCFTKDKEAQTQNCTINAVTPNVALSMLLSPEIIVGCWNKIYKRSFLVDNGIKFSTELRYGEGLRFITTVAQKVKRVGIGNKKAYYYRKNNNNSATTTFNIGSLYNGEKAINLIKSDLSICDERVETMLLLHESMYAAGAITRLIEAREKSAYKNDYKRWLRFVRRNWLILAKSKDVSLYRKCLLLCCCVSPGILAELDRIRRQRISATSVT